MRILLNPYMHTNRVHFPKIRALFFYFQKRAGRPPPSPNLCYKNDKTTYKRYKFDGIASQFGLHQIINEPTHFTRNAYSWIDLIFT